MATPDGPEFSHREGASAADPRELVAACARRLAEAGLLIGTAGNISVREPASGGGADRFWVTGTGVRLGECTADDVTAVDTDGAVLEGRLVPTSEVDLHLGVYAARPDTSAIVHTHAPAATAVACVLYELPVLHYQQLALGGALRVAKYATFGTPELADHVISALTDRQAALMSNHGAIAVGSDLAKAEEHALLVEWLAGLHLRASSLGEPRVLGEEQQAAVIQAAIDRKYGTTQENA